MDAHNVAIIFSPNLVYQDETAILRPEVMMMDMEWGNRLVELLIIHVKDIFEK